MARPVNQHWVPQFYLREFAIPETRAAKEAYVWIFSRNEEDGIEKKTNIRNICAKRYLYSPRSDSGERDYEVDGMLNDLETILSQMWRDIAWDYVNLADEALRKAVSLFVANMYMRHPSNQELSKRVHSHLVKMYEQAPKKSNGIPNIDCFIHNGKKYEIDSSDWYSYNSWNENDHHAAFASLILKETYAITEILIKKRWSIGLIDAEYLITSDKPVSVQHQSRQIFGIGTLGAIITFPLSPTRILIMDDLYQEPCNQYYKIPKEKVGAFNYGIWCEVSRFLITGRPIPDVLSEMAEFIEKNVNH